MRVLIIGAGISGLTAGHVLLRDGLDVSVVERQADGVGGCWRQAFGFVKVQSTRHEYRMPGRHFPPGTAYRPGRADVLTYWSDVVADDPQLSQSIRLGTEVVSLRRQAKGGAPAQPRLTSWTVELRDSKTAQTCTEHYDFVVVATGLYGCKDLAMTPDLPGAANFPGQVGHAVELAPDFRPPANEKAVVVGFGPTALAFASHWASLGCETHLVVKEKRWFVPSRFLGGLIPHASILYSRANAAMLPYHEPLQKAELIIHKYFAWLVALFWRFVELLIIISALPPRALVPPLGNVLKAMRCAIPVVPQPFMGHCRAGRIRLHLEKVISSLGKDGSVHLSDGSVIPGPVDRVILATGYNLPTFPWMDPSLRANVCGRDRQLYRNMLVPGEDGIAFIGFSSSFMGCVTEYVQAHWLSSVLQGTITLPSTETMQSHCAKVREWSRRSTNYEAQQVYCVNSRHFQYMESLLADMGLTEFRTSLLSSIFWRWGPENFANLFSERRNATKHSALGS